MSVVDGVEVRPDICIEHPADLLLNRDGECIERVVRRPFGSEPVRKPDELRLIDWLQHHPHCLLGKLVLQGDKPERSCCPITLRDENTPHRLWVVAATVNAVL